MSYSLSHPTHSYNRQLFLRTARALLIARETFVRINKEGMICIQHLLNDPNQDSPLTVTHVLHASLPIV